MPKIILTTRNSGHLYLGPGKLKIGKFPDGELSVVVQEPVKGKEVVLIGSVYPPAESIMELVFALESLVRHGAAKIKLIIPYFGYAKSDREKIPGQSLSAKAIIKILESLGGDKLEIFSVNIHSKDVSDFFNVPFKNLDALKFFAPLFKRSNIKVASPDFGGMERARKFALLLGHKEVVVINKTRISPTKVKAESLEGEVNGFDVVLVDDMVQSGGTMLEAIATLKKAGANKIYIVSVHMVYKAGGYRRLATNPYVEKIYTTNSIKPIPNLPVKISVADVSDLLRQYL